MLIESAKDSLSFSVTHYKRPKQPHTVQVRHLFLFTVLLLLLCTLTGLFECFQAKTVEEKKLWAHHIKRLILENHQAIIPQKVRAPHQSHQSHLHTHTSVISTKGRNVCSLFQAKDAILEMNPTCESLLFLLMLSLPFLSLLLMLLRL